MFFIVAGPLAQYQDLFSETHSSGIYSKVENVSNRLKTIFNFNLLESDPTYNDFWEDLLSPFNLKTIDFTGYFTSIINHAQNANTVLGERYMDYVGMITSLDQYICYISDAFSRVCDTAWAFGDGQVYDFRTGKLLEDGNYEIVRYGLNYYSTEIYKVIDEMLKYMDHDPGVDAEIDSFGMIKSKFNDLEYLSYKKTNYFIPKIRYISTLLEGAYAECGELVVLAEKVNLAVTKWLPETFKLVAYTSLTFNLNKKMDSLANKMISYSNMLIGTVPPQAVVTTTALIAVNQGKFWREKILPDQSNRMQCLTEAIIAGSASLGYPKFLESFIDTTWDFMIPKYG